MTVYEQDESGINLKYTTSNYGYCFAFGIRTNFESKKYDNETGERLQGETNEREMVPNGRINVAFGGIDTELFCEERSKGRPVLYLSGFFGIDDYGCIYAMGKDNKRIFVSDVVKKSEEEFERKKASGEIVCD